MFNSSVFDFNDWWLDEIHFIDYFFAFIFLYSTDNVFQQRLHLAIRTRAALQIQDHKVVHWVQVWVTQTQTIQWVRATHPNKQNNYQKQIYILEVYNRERLIKIYKICVHSKYYQELFSVLIFWIILCKFLLLLMLLLLFIMFKSLRVVGRS